MNFPTSPPLCSEHTKKEQFIIDDQEQISPDCQQVTVSYGLSRYNTLSPSLSANKGVNQRVT